LYAVPLCVVSGVRKKIKSAENVQTVSVTVKKDHVEDEIVSFLLYFFSSPAMYRFFCPYRLDLSRLYYLLGAVNLLNGKYDVIVSLGSTSQAPIASTLLFGVRQFFRVLVCDKVK